MTKRVCILQGDSFQSAFDMFKRREYEPVYSPNDADIICYLGGTDVDPELYGAKRHPKTQSPDKQRDAYEKAMFFNHPEKFHVGICRGGQLLNVLNGGEMEQHVGPYSGLQPMWDNTKEEIFDVIVDHHQAMLSISGVVLAWHNYSGDDYAVWYPSTKSLCFQPHPEWGHKPTEDYFFNLLEKYLKEGN